MEPSLPGNHRDNVTTALTSTRNGSCRFCGQPIPMSHRQTKKFCGDLCRCRFHYARRQEAQAALRRHLNEAAEALRAAQTMLN